MTDEIMTLIHLHHELIAAKKRVKRYVVIFGLLILAAWVAAVHFIFII